MVSGRPYRLSDVEGEALLLVEGFDEARFFTAMLGFLKLDHVQIASVNGKGNFAAVQKNTLVKARNFPTLQRLVLVRDADQSAQSAYLKFVERSRRG